MDYMELSTMNMDRKHQAIFVYAGFLLATLALAAGCSSGGSGGGPGWPTNAPSEVTYLLPKFECAQAPTKARCCPAGSTGAISSSEGCCKAHGAIMDARKAAVKTAHPEYSNEQILNAIIYPFTAEENATYVAGCCGALSEPNKGCCTAAMSGGDLSACVDVPPPSVAGTATASLRCYAAPENMVEIDGKQVILGVTKDGTPTEMTVEVGPPEGSTAAALELPALVGGRIDFNQTKGPEIDMTTGTGKAGPAALTGTKMLFQSLGIAANAPPAHYKFLAPDLPSGAGARVTENPTFGFAALLYNAGGQPIASATCDCPEVIVGRAGGGGCGCGKADLTPHERRLFLRNVSALMLLLVAGWYYWRRRVVQGSR